MRRTAEFTADSFVMAMPLRSALTALRVAPWLERGLAGLALACCVAVLWPRPSAPAQSRQSAGSAQVRESVSESTAPGLGRILVIIPTYNEVENIATIVGRIRQAVPEADVLIADDNSPDGTGKLADELAAADRNVHVMHRLGKEGLGAAYLAGFGGGSTTTTTCSWRWMPTALTNRNSFPGCSVRYSTPIWCWALAGSREAPC